MQGLQSSPLEAGSRRFGRVLASNGSCSYQSGNVSQCSSSPLAERHRVSPRRNAVRSALRVRAVAEVDAPKRGGAASVSIDNSSDPKFTVVSIKGYSKPGLLTSLTGTFRDLGLDVSKVSASTYF